MSASACPPTMMTPTPCSASTAQKRSRGLCSTGSSNLPHPQRSPPSLLGPARALCRRDTHVGADEREGHAALVILTRRAERPRGGRSADREIAAGTGQGLPSPPRTGDGVP